MQVHFAFVEVTQLFKMEVPLSTFSHYFGISSILSLTSVTGDTPKESLLEKRSNWDASTCLCESWLDFTACLLEQISPVKSWSSVVLQKLKLRSVLSKIFTHHHKKCMCIETPLHELTYIWKFRTDLCVHERVKSSCCIDASYCKHRGIFWVRFILNLSRHKNIILQPLVLVKW